MTLTAHFPALQVVIPLIAAPLTVLLRRRAPAFFVALAASWSAFAIASFLLIQVMAHGPISYAIGNWPAPWGIEYRVDTLSAFLLVLVSGVAAMVLPYSRASIEREVPLEQHYLFYTMLTLCLAGLLGMCITGDAFNIFVFLEVSSLSTYVLIALGRDRRALLAAYQYLIMGSIGATFIVIGIGLLYLMTGTLNLADMGQRIAAVEGSRPVLAALAFLTVGISLKLALFPLHQWLPNAYAYAPSSVSSFLSATATKVAVYVLLRFYFTVFGKSQVFDRLPMAEMLLLLALAGMFVASRTAIFQVDLKRLFAYSSVAQIGYIILGLSFYSQSGLTGGIVHMLNHGVTKGAIFMLLGCVALGVGGTMLSDVRGLGKRMPWTSFALLIGGLSLIGIPGTAGFVSKWYLLLAAFQTGQWVVVALILLSSLLAVAYVWRFVEVAYLGVPDGPTPQPRAIPLAMAIPTIVMVLACIYFGLDTRFSVGPASSAADLLLTGGLR
jgi:multicomponent Na+:H+ antiporter subunit D